MHCSLYYIQSVKEHTTVGTVDHQNVVISVDEKDGRGERYTLCRQNIQVGLPVVNTNLGIKKKYNKF